MPVFNIYKPAGLTPLQVIERLKELRPELKDVPMTYAGRLDPMAEGVLILLSGDDRLKKDEYLGLKKTYEATFLFGFSSDSFDALGLVKKGGVVPDVDAIKKELHSLERSHSIPFPPYSSYKVKGKPLHAWMQEGRIDEIAIPIKKMQVLKVSALSMRTEDADQLLSRILERIKKVDGDFRQTEITERWQKVMVGEKLSTMASATFEVASGTYIRSLAEEMGKNLGCGALLLTLKRTAVGDYRAHKSLRFP